MDKSKALTQWGDRESVREIATRLKMTMPGSNKLTGAEAAALAQVAVAHNLDPFNGEVWLIKGKDGQARGLMVGIKGLRKLAKRQLEREAEKTQTHSASMWHRFIRIPEEEATVEYDAKPGDIVYRCELRDSITIGAWLAAVAGVKAQLGSDAVPEEHIGPAPVTIGIGIFHPGESSKMEPNECARKRAEANAIKQRFDVDFAEVSENSGPIIEADFREIGEEPSMIPDESPRRPERVVKRELGYEVPPMTLSELRQFIEDGAHQASQRGTLVVSPGMRGLLVGTLNSALGNNQDRYLFCESVTGYKSSKDIPDEYIVSMLEWLGLKWVEGQAPRPADASKESIAELRAAVHEIHVLAGQQEMQI